jgi:hypothetical protein
MKFKALRKKETLEFVKIQEFGETRMNVVFTSELPNPQPMTATMDLIKKHYEGKINLQDFNFDDYELVEFEIYEADTVGADIRNKLNPTENLVRMLEEFFTEPFEPRSNLARMKQNDLIRLIKKEMIETKINIKYIADLL